MIELQHKIFIDEIVDMDRVLVGLGNPGARYAGTRHNIGFEIIKHIAQLFSFSEFVLKNDALVSTGVIGTFKIALVKPMSYMNNSGIPLLRFMQFFKVNTQKLIVFHDELELELGRCKMKLGGGHAGHNGLRSIDQHVGKDYYRMRIGISRPQNQRMDISNYVLSKFSLGEIEDIEKLKQLIAKSMDDILMLQTSNFNSIAGEFFRSQIKKLEE